MLCVIRTCQRSCPGKVGRYMFYTKYRPQKFSEISKPNDAATALVNQVSKNKAAHAYLFIGPRGTGKTTTARILAKALNCEKLHKNGDPCDKCSSCKAIRSGTYMDLIEIDAASNRGIDDVRELRDRIKLAPTEGKQKIYIIDEVHMLTKEAFNALLKTLEEPPKHATFVLCTTEDYKVPDTIKSRCQIFKFKRATVEQIVKKLEKICKKEKVEVTKEGLTRIAEASFGGFRDAENMLQQVVEGSLDLESFLGVGERENYVDLVDHLLKCDSNLAIKQINKLYNDGVDMYLWTVELTKYLRDLLFIATDSYEGLVDVTDDVLSKMEEQSSKFDVGELVRILEIFIEAQNSIKGSFITQLPVELAIVKACSLLNSESPKEIENNTTENRSINELEKGNPSNKGKSSDIDIKLIKEKWGEVLKAAGPHNSSVKALLKSTRPKEISEDVVVLEVFYKFHKERLETTKNKKIVEMVIEKVFSVPMSIKCILTDKNPEKKDKKAVGELTDYNVVVPANEVFDGSLPL